MASQKANLGLIEIAKTFLPILESGNRVKIGVYTLCQVFLSFLDFIGLMVLGLVVALATNSIFAGKAETLFSLQLQSLPFVRGYEESHLFAFLLTSLILLFVAKSLFSIVLIKKLMQLMGEIASDLSKKIFEVSFLDSTHFFGADSKQKRIFTITRGVDYLCLFVMGPFFVLIADLLAIFILGIGIFLANPVVMLVLTLTAALTTSIVTRKLQRKSNALGKMNAETNIQVNETIFESLGIYRELVVRDARDIYVQEVVKLRSRLARNTAVFNTLPYISKYIMELAILFAGSSLALYHYLIGNLVSALSSFVFFTVASARITPIVLRVQQGLISIKGNLGNATSTIEFIEKNLLSRKKTLVATVKSKRGVPQQPNTFDATVELKNLSYKHHPNSNFSISRLNLKITSGERVALVGPSGAGKSTLVDLILGVYKPTSGQVTISHEDPVECFKKWPGKVEYVPQVVGLIKGSFRENLVLGLEDQHVADIELQEALVFANLWDLVSKLPKGVDSQIEESGLNLSLGQKQRLGIARALVTKPKLLILDEATSSLDAESEEVIMKAMKSIYGRVTTITIAHRLSTIAEASRVIYLDSGRVIAEGTFQELRAKVPNFDIQASLLGL